MGCPPIALLEERGLPRNPDLPVAESGLRKALLGVSPRSGCQWLYCTGLIERGADRRCGDGGMPGDGIPGEGGKGIPAYAGWSLDG